MKKPKYLYHGSIRKITGEKLIPKKAEDLEKDPKSMHRAVYATDVKNIAIAMSIISCKGVYGADLKFKKKPYGIIYDGWPKQKYIYLYTLDAKDFEQMGGDGKQWASFNAVKPIKTERLIVEDYLNLVRKATKTETNRWLKKHGFELWEKKLK